MESQIEIEVARVQPFGFNLTARVAYRHQHGVIALSWAGILDPNGQGIKGVGANLAQVDVARTGLIVVIAVIVVIVIVLAGGYSAGWFKPSGSKSTNCATTSTSVIPTSASSPAPAATGTA